jgi:hypothetical protein
MKLVYVALNDYDKGSANMGFPLDIVVFNDGMQIHLSTEQVVGEILFEFPFEGNVNITAADKAFLQATNQKKIPSNVVVNMVP